LGAVGPDDSLTILVGTRNQVRQIEHSEIMVAQFVGGQLAGGPDRIGGRWLSRSARRWRGQWSCWTWPETDCSVVGQACPALGRWVAGSACARPAPLLSGKLMFCSWQAPFCVDETSRHPNSHGHRDARRPAGNASGILGRASGGCHLLRAGEPVVERRHRYPQTTGGFAGRKYFVVVHKSVATLRVTTLATGPRTLVGSPGYLLTKPSNCVSRERHSAR
jgi:hypothetical protein